MRITHKGETYELDVELAIETGVAAIPINCKLGDVFGSKTRTKGKGEMVLIVSKIYGNTGDDVYYLAGRSNAEFGDPWKYGPSTLPKLNSYMKQNGFVFIKNINEEVEKILHEL